jgi:hypothetical protein
MAVVIETVMNDGQRNEKEEKDGIVNDLESPAVDHEVKVEVDQDQDLVPMILMMILDQIEIRRRTRERRFHDTKYDKGERRSK